MKPLSLRKRAALELFRNREWMRRGPCASCRHWRYCEGNGMHLRDSEGNLMHCHLLK